MSISISNFFSNGRLGKSRSAKGIAAGTYFPDRDQPPLTPDEEDTVNRFHDLYYRRWGSGTADTINLSWFGYKLLKCPLDLWMYQELLVRTRPDVVVEAGTFCGGSALYLAMMLDLVGHGRVITIDINAKPDFPVHPRLTYTTGSSTDPSIVAAVTDQVGNGSAMIILDSDHSRDHVLAEMNAYSPLVPVGGYLIVEDSNVNGHPTLPDFGPGPMEAIEQFLTQTNEFAPDERCERFLMTLNPRGYLRRISGRGNGNTPSRT
jgi:cephalosporin hydroxylase